MESEARQATEAVTTVTETDGLLDAVLAKGRLAPAARDLVAELVDQVMVGAAKVDKTLEATLNRRIAEIDAAISAQLSAVMHAEDFQKLEATWRGFEKLVFDTETSQSLKIRVLNITKKEIHKDVTRAVEFDQSMLFKKVYQEEFGVLGGEPFGVLVGDYYFDNSVQDVEVLKGISGVAAAAHAPFVSGTNPSLFRMQSYTDLENPRDLAKIFTGPEYVDWNDFRNSEDSRYVALTLPHYLGRLPYGRRGRQVDQFDFEESVDGTDHDKYLWANAAWLLAGRITNAFALHGWCTTIRGVEGGGLVGGLPTHTFTTDEGLVAAKCPTEVQITDTRENELSKLGFVALVHAKGQNYATFMSGQSIQRPKKYLDDAATANAELSARLPYIMVTSRIAHYLKCIVRDKVGAYMGKEALQAFLSRWISEFVLDDDNPSPEQIAKRPLREAVIAVEEIPGQPGVYRAVAHLRPFIQLEAVTVSLRLVANLPPPAK